MKYFQNHIYNLKVFFYYLLFTPGIIFPYNPDFFLTSSEPLTHILITIHLKYQFIKKYLLQRYVQSVLLNSRTF